VRQNCHGATGHHGEGLHVIREAVDLNAINLAASECARERVDRDVFRLDVASRFEKLLVECCSFDFAALADSGAKDGILSQ
jgi:hypothetical protein